jgi:putative transposase
MRMRRLRGFQYEGLHRYSLTIALYDRRPLFRSAAVVDVVLRQILPAAESCGYEIIAYCFMPDHLHLVVQASEHSTSLPMFVQRAKQLSGYHAKRIAGRAIWQAGYYERVLRDHEDTADVVAYVLANPVRAGLVDNPANYPFSGSAVWSLSDLLEYVESRRRPS